jgi:hypothetical protein
MFLLVSCCFTLVICYFTLVICGGGVLGNFLGDGSIKFFNRSPLTLKFGAEKKRERESRKREREREPRKRERESERARARESKLLFLRSQVVVVLHS